MEPTGYIQSNIVLPLWENEIPGQKKVTVNEFVSTQDPGLIWVENITTPAIEVFLPSKGNSTGKAVIICPGGGYEGLAYDWEGSDIAKLFNSKGIAGIVLKYRLPNHTIQDDPPSVLLQDAQRAIRLVRSYAVSWNINPDTIGIMGFSAGGHMAATLSTRYAERSYNTYDDVDKLSSRPDFTILVYPVISMQNGITHQGTRNALLKDNTDKIIIDSLSCELNVSKSMPPTFIVHSADDTSVPVENSLLYFKALNNEGVPVEMHIYPKGGHGYSLAVEDEHLSTWPERLFDWIMYP